jgi:hypothetical protein
MHMEMTQDSNHENVTSLDAKLPDYMQQHTNSSGLDPYGAPPTHKPVGKSDVFIIFLFLLTSNLNTDSHTPWQFKSRHATNWNRAIADALLLASLASEYVSACC